MQYLPFVGIKHYHWNFVGYAYVIHTGLKKLLFFLLSRLESSMIVHLTDAPRYGGPYHYVLTLAWTCNRSSVGPQQGWRTEEYRSGRVETYFSCDCYEK